MLMPRRIGSFVGALMAVTALAACGGASAKDKNTYVDQINAALGTYATRATETRNSITPDSSARQDERSFDRFEGAIKEVITRLGAAKVPADVAKEHAKLVAVFTGLRDDVAEARRTLRTQTVRAQAEGQRLLGAATITANTKQDAARQAINAKLRAD